MLRINEIFYSLQGEGYNTGRAAVFVRFAGCNMRCPFCDTSYDTFREMTPEDIVKAIQQYPARFIVLTGGEPTLQVDESFIDLLHRHNLEVAMESNGTRPAPRNIDWLTVSPKEQENLGQGTKALWRQPDEIKLVFDERTDPDAVLSKTAFTVPAFCYLQPCDTGDSIRNASIVNQCVNYIKQHPLWRLSLQTHKLAGFQ